jgi:acetoin utilization protein AcuC
MRAAFIHSPEIEKYQYPPECPFRTERASLARQTLLSMDLLDGKRRVEVPPQAASRETLLEFHAERYVDALEAAPRGYLDAAAFNMGIGTPDCPVFPGMYEYAALACGASIAGAELILSGEADFAFNPSGGYHHAHASRAGGFCYINDAVFACLRLAAAGKRVLFLDIDVHHCDGVQDAFYDRKDILVLSFHEDPRMLFPGTGMEDEVGVGEGKGYTVNVPLPAGLYDEAYLKIFRAVAPPIIKKFQPEVIVLEAGMDMLAGDPLAHLNLTNNAYADIAEYLAGLRLPILALGGGGYHVKNTVRGWALLWSIFCGESSSADDMSFGMGGVMLETTDWRGGLRDRVLVPDAKQRGEVEPALVATLEKVRANVFPLLRL